MSGVVVLAQDDPSSRVIVAALRRLFPVAAVLIEPPEDRWFFLKRRARRLGWVTVAGQVAFVLAGPWLGRGTEDRIQEILDQAGLTDEPIPPSLLRPIPSVNDSGVSHLLEELAPEVVVVNGTRILAKRILECIPVPVINMHMGITPAYRGIHGGYWALAQGDAANCGVTVHLVDSGIDTGDILYQGRIQPGPADSYWTYPALQLATGVPLLMKAVDHALQGTLKPYRRGDLPSANWSHPTLAGYLLNRWRAGVR